VLEPLILYWNEVASYLARADGRLGAALVERIRDWLVNAPIPDELAELDERELLDDLVVLRETVFLDSELRYGIGERLRAACGGDPRGAAVADAGYLRRGDRLVG